MPACGQRDGLGGFLAELEAQSSGNKGQADVLRENGGRVN